MHLQSNRTSSKMASVEIFAAGMINRSARQHHKAPACVSVRHTRAMDLCSLHVNIYGYVWWLTAHRIMLETHAGYFGSICIAPWGASRRSATDSQEDEPECENHSAWSEFGCIYARLIFIGILIAIFESPQGIISAKVGFSWKECQVFDRTVCLFIRYRDIKWSWEFAMTSMGRQIFCPPNSVYFLVEKWILKKSGSNKFQIRAIFTLVCA